MSKKKDDKWSTGMSETEKITINLGLVDLGQIDLLSAGGLLLQPYGLHSDGHPQPANDARRGGQADGGAPPRPWCSG